MKKQPAQQQNAQQQQPDLAPADLLALDFDSKLKLLDKITAELLSLRLEFARVAGEHARLQANIKVLTEVKGALQTSLKAEGM